MGKFLYFLNCFFKARVKKSSFLDIFGEILKALSKCSDKCSITHTEVTFLTELLSVGQCAQENCVNLMQNLFAELWFGKYVTVFSHLCLFLSLNYLQELH